MATATGAAPAMTTNKNKPRKVNTNCGNCEKSVCVYIGGVRSLSFCVDNKKTNESHFLNHSRPLWCPMRKEVTDAKD